MCGIVGLFLKDPSLEPQLGRLFTPMLQAMGDRGPDSAGFAVYRNPAAAGSTKLTLRSSNDAVDWVGLRDGLAEHTGGPVEITPVASHAVVVAGGSPDTLRSWIGDRYPELGITSAGKAIEIFKEVGRPSAVADRFGLEGVAGTHAIGHTRMATESAVTTQHSHPFSTGLDLCLVHNGSLSNHNRLRQRLRRRGVAFETDNDSEVAAGFLADRLTSGDSLEAALRAGLRELDGFFTFAVGTARGFAVLRDAIACKPAVLAETDRWAAMASEYRSLAHLPGADRSRIWEPAPATVYSWSLN